MELPNFTLISETSNQEVFIQLGESNISLTDDYKISIMVKNDRLKTYDSFPEIEGFTKGETTSSTSTNFINGRMSSTQTLTQKYKTINSGYFPLEPFEMSINGKVVQSEGTKLL